MGNLSIQIDNYYTEFATGKPVNKNVVTDAYRGKFPFTLFNKIDIDSELFNTYKSITRWLFVESPSGFNVYNNSYAYAREVNLLPINFGDSLLLFETNPPVTTFYYRVLVYRYLQNSIASIFKNPTNLKVKGFYIYTSNYEQYSEPLTFINYKNANEISTKEIIPLKYEDLKHKPDTPIFIPLEFTINLRLGITSNLLFETDKINFNFII